MRIVVYARVELVYTTIIVKKFWIRATFAKRALMKYYKYADDYGPLENATSYVEADNMITLRQVTIGSDDVIISCHKHLQWGFQLAEKPVNYDTIVQVSKIEKTEFDIVWLRCLAQHTENWETTKSLFPLGQSVAGHIEIFYPQGVIINLGDNVLGVANYNECRTSTQSEFMYPGHRITAMVTGYDEQNQWIELGSPQVYEERLPRK